MGEKIKLKSVAEIETMREGGLILANILKSLRDRATIGMEASKLDALAGSMAAAAGAKCSFKGYHGFPYNICFSLNDEVVHGFPENKTIKAGDLVSLDLGIEYKGLFTDASISFVVGDGRVNGETQDFLMKNKLVKTTLNCLKDSLSFCRPGSRLGDIGHAIQSRAEGAGFSVVRDLVGHGVGHAVHEDPFVLNIGRPNQGMKLMPGLVLAIEPMLNAGTFKVILDRRSRWAYKTKDGSPSAHFEWTVAITEAGPKVLTPLDWFKFE